MGESIRLILDLVLSNQFSPHYSRVGGRNSENPTLLCSSTPSSGFSEFAQHSPKISLRSSRLLENNAAQPSNNSSPALFDLQEYVPLHSSGLDDKSYTVFEGIFSEFSLELPNSIDFGPSNLKNDIARLQAGSSCKAIWEN